MELILCGMWILGLVLEVILFTGGWVVWRDQKRMRHEHLCEVWGTGPEGAERVSILLADLRRTEDLAPWLGLDPHRFELIGVVDGSHHPNLLASWQERFALFQTAILPPPKGETSHKTSEIFALYRSTHCRHAHLALLDHRPSDHITSRSKSFRFGQRNPSTNPIQKAWHAASLFASGEWLLPVAAGETPRAEAFEALARRAENHANPRIWAWRSADGKMLVRFDAVERAEGFGPRLQRLLRGHTQSMWTLRILHSEKPIKWPKHGLDLFHAGIGTIISTLVGKITTKISPIDK